MSIGHSAQLIGLALAKWSLVKHWGFPNNCGKKDSKLQDFSDGDTWWTTESIATSKERDLGTSNVSTPWQQEKFRKVCLVIQVFCSFIPNNDYIIITAK